MQIETISSTDDKFIVTQNMKFVIHRVENIVEKVEIPDC